MSYPQGASRSLHQAFAAARGRAADRPFLAESACSGGRQWSFEQAGQEVDALVQAYRGQGWGQGHRVALAVGNHPRHFFHFLALNQLGASIVPLIPDHRAGEILDIILQDEISHVAAGNRWYRHLCKERGLDPMHTYAELIAQYDAPKLRPPFNIAARRLAGFEEVELACLGNDLLNNNQPQHV
jgi:acyl-coenzyme A synthetase/AMP-(fatty) acid ligase